MAIYLHKNITIVQSLQCVLSCIVNFAFCVFNMQTSFKQHFFKKKKKNNEKNNKTLHDHNSW